MTDPTGVAAADTAPRRPPTGTGATERLARWFERSGRDLPWRRTRDPWAILVAELMLQQTQVSRVAERWPGFLLRFPDPATLAGSSPADVIAAWSGLGYNRRAVFLHRAALAMVKHHRGAVPRERADLLALPGVGPYTARAVRVFAFEAADAVVDTNVARILARLTNATLTASQAQQRADELVRGVDAGPASWTHNQALLDVGAGHCRPRRPDCVECPLASGCAWYAAGRPDPDPALGSAGVSGPQSRFVGSNREGRGRLLRALRCAAVPAETVAVVMGWPTDEARAAAVAATLVDDGLIVRDGAHYRLPRLGDDEV